MFDNLSQREAIMLHHMLSDEYTKLRAIGRRATIDARACRTQYARDYYNRLANDMAALRTEINTVMHAIADDGPYPVVSLAKATTTRKGQ